MSGLSLKGVPVPVSADFNLSFVDVDGRRRCELLSSCWMVPFERVLPVRTFSSYKGMKNFSGLWWSATTSEHVGYESWLERDQVMALDFDPDVTGLSSQPFQLSWQQDAEDCSHTPDYFVRLRDGTGVVIEVRDDDRIDTKDTQAFAATERACRAVGWEFRRVAAIEAVRASNLRWLAGYRHPRCMDTARANSLRQAFREPHPLLEGTMRVGDPIAVLPILRKLRCCPWRAGQLAKAIHALEIHAA
jgi:hypothetical protein